MEWNEIGDGDRLHYRAVGDRGVYDLRNVQKSWELWFKAIGERRFVIKTTGIKHLFEAKRMAATFDATGTLGGTP